MDTRGAQAERPAASASRLRTVLAVMFPAAYIERHHGPPRSPCTLFAMRPGPAERQPAAGPATVGRREPSSEPSSRARVALLSRQFAASLVEHQAKPTGLCPVRRAIYDQCFDELIRQVTVGCVEQGLLLFRIRNELRTTLDYYRQIYESAARFGINKAIGAQLELREAKSKLEVQADAAKLDELDPTDSNGQSNANKLNESESLARIRDFYQGELSQREHIITEQRNIIEALTRKITQAVKSPL